MKDTIVAIATPLGRSGIGVIRLSGNLSLEIVRKLIEEPEFAPEPRKALLKKILDQDGEVVDNALVTYFQQPKSFTGEDVFEISCHGSPVLLRQVLDACLRFNARLAEAGEFTLRALANGQINLSQAEAIRDLIDANTTTAVRQAAKQLRGEFSNQLQPLKDDLLNVIVVLESALEFVEDDLPDVAAENIKATLSEIQSEITRLADTFRAGRLIREGLKVALVGRPNVGKSSLFNSLLGENRAIVTEIAGTTRDQLRESFSIRGIPVSLIDTAGLRKTEDVVEMIGVERTGQAIVDADLIAVIIDSSEKLTSEDFEVFDQVKGLEYLVVSNKTDLSVERHDLRSKLPDPSRKIIEVSAKTGFGLTELQNAIIEPFSVQDVESAGFLVSDARHYDLLRRAQIEIATSLQLFENKTSEEIVLIGLHNALKLLGEITGETATEEILGRIFSTFCVGK